MGTQPPIPGTTRRPTIKDVAGALGVAVSTVSNAYNRPDQLSAELRAKVFATAAAIGYAGPHPAARGLRKQSTGQIAVLLGQSLAMTLIDPVATATLQGIAAVLSDHRLALLLVPAQSVGGPPVVDGTLVMGLDASEPTVARVRAYGGPVVLIDQTTDFDLPAITVGDDQAGRGIFSHVVGLGHSRIAIVVDRLQVNEVPGRVSAQASSTATFGRASAQLRGFQLGALNASIPWETVPVYAAAADTEVAGQAISELVLADVPTPTVILCTSDRLAAGVMTGLLQANVRVPDDTSVVGFDDTPLARATVPPLTSVRLDHDAKGRAAARTLLALMENRPPPEPLRAVAKIVLRSTLKGPRLYDHG
ncbi:MAG TPA: LacI family DNA-binding transcriptional regulator [Thermomicrobiales bacterium]|nr:LacI family DNA-binding transcriptional regulator [Thermomicrobiales bacterium]HRA46751.1 LacI family DNA-binding transcriptional regulator [Thermomicrobiales bacterium]